MHHPDKLPALPTHQATRQPEQARVDLYDAAHTRLRQHLAVALRAMGSIQVDDPAGREAALAALEQLTQAVRRHLRCEIECVHAAIEARCPGGARLNASQHAQRLEATAGLEAEALHLRRAAPEQRSALARRLYRHLISYAEQAQQQMLEVQVRHNGLLWALYADDELMSFLARMNRQETPPAAAAPHGGG